MPQKDVCFHLIEHTKVLCKNGKIIIPTSLRHRAVSWYHHYLQHPGHLHLEETMRSMMYWNSMRTTIRRYIKTCRSCQVNKRHSQKYGHPPSKLVITTHWKALCVDLLGPYTLKGSDRSSIDFMCLTMIDPTASWFKIVQLPTVTQEMTVPPAGKDKKEHFHKSLRWQNPTLRRIQLESVTWCIKPGLVDIHVVDILYTTTEANSNFTSDPYAIHMG